MRTTGVHVLAFLAKHGGAWVIPTQIPNAKGEVGKVSGTMLRELNHAGLVEYGKEPKHSLYGYRLTPLGAASELALRHRLENYDSVSKRIVDQEGQVVALALKLGNDQWCLSDTNGTRVSKAAFATPKDALAAFINRQIEDGMKRQAGGTEEAPPRKWPVFETKDLGDDPDDTEMLRRWEVYNTEMQVIIASGTAHKDDDGWWVDTASGELIGPDPEIERPLSDDQLARMKPGL